MQLVLYVIGSLGVLLGGNRVPKLSVFGKIGQAVVSMICRQKDNFVSAIFSKIAQPANLSHANSI